MKVLFLLRDYGVTDGASVALHDFIDSCPELEGSRILSRWVKSNQPGLNIRQVETPGQVKEELERGQYDLVHYFKVWGYDLLPWALQAMKQLGLDLPVVTTVCQRPSFPGLWLAPWEIQASTKIVFIDKASYHDGLYPFIPPEKKEQIYFGSTGRVIDLTGKLLSQPTDHNGVIYGRGSTLSKCPADMIETFDKIQVKDKQLVVAGIPEDSWVGQAAKLRPDIQVIPVKPMQQWLETCMGFDVFLYQLPPTSHASIDGTLAHAMLLEKPVVYCGSEAPKERFIHGVNGFVASTPLEMAEYATRLGLNPQLRQAMGKKARQSIINTCSMELTASRYRQLYGEVLSHPRAIKVKIPRYYRGRFLLNTSRQLVATRLLAGTAAERLYRKARPL